MTHSSNSATAPANNERGALLPLIASRVFRVPLLIHEDKLNEILLVLGSRVGMDAASLTELSKQVHAVDRANVDASTQYIGTFDLDPNDPTGKTRKPYRTVEGIGILPVYGTLVNKGGWLDALSGMTSYSKVQHLAGLMAKDPAVKSVLLDIDSPGGEAIGAMETGSAIRQLAGTKRVTAYVSGMMCSAAYAIGAGANEIVIPQTGLAGSIGTVMTHFDRSQQYADMGIKPTLIHAGDFKVDGNPFEPLRDEVKTRLKAEVDRFNDIFVAHVASMRSGLSEEMIRSLKAGTKIGADAVASGLADRVGTFDAVISKLPRASGRSQTVSGGSMTEFTRAQVDQMITEANNALRATLSAEHQTALSQAITAERARINAIVSCDEAKGRETFALKLATTTSLSADEAKPLLAAAGKETPAPAAPPKPAQQVQTVEGLAVVSNPPQQTAPQAPLDYDGIYKKRAQLQGRTH